ncbi:hypothetical protein OPT61_g1205 [Boeremia exigua]|uniref:Uncharacterized protein n=1 Tax=Boeremia exigua TaxID=749465 RepID=A0ACC2IR88_9PLEO|nr:hypothetical protein OPT61_g1205 [Boeremia exigua]
MAHRLYIPPCVDTPAHPNHFPPLERPLRIHIQGPLASIQRLLPLIAFHYEDGGEPFPQPAAPELAELTFQALYGWRTEKGEKLVIRDEYNAWKRDPTIMEIDYYGVTFDYEVPDTETDSEVLALNIIEMEETSGDYANGIEVAQMYLRIQFNAEDYRGVKVLAVPRCCQEKKRNTGPGQDQLGRTRAGSKDTKGLFEGRCTFVETTQPRKRPMQLESSDAASSGPLPIADRVEVPESHISTVSPEDQGGDFLNSIANFQSQGLPDNSDQDLLFGSFDDQFFGDLGETEPDALYSQAYLVPEREMDSGNHLVETDVMESRDWLDTEPNGIPLDANNSLHPQALGHSGDMDPYLLQKYRYDLSGAFKFKQLSIHSVSNGTVPTQFLLSEPRLFAHSRVEMGLPHTSSDPSRNELESLVSVETGQRLIALFRRLVLPQCPIFSDRLFPDPQSSPPYLLAALYIVAQPFAKLDDVLSIELAYENLNTQGLFKIVNEALQWEAHNPSLSVVQTMLLLILRPSTDPLVLESSLKWSLHGTLVATCQTLGLHHNPSSWSITPWQISLRRRISSIVFSLDKWLASSLGRPPLITRDTWLVTSPTAADGYASSMSPEVWSQYLCYAKLGPLLGDVLFRLFSLTAISDLTSNLPKTLDVSKPLLDELTSWHHEYLQQPFDSAEKDTSLYTVCTLGYHYIQMTIFRAIMRPFVANIDSDAETTEMTGQSAEDQRDVLNFARTGVRSTTTSATSFVKSLKEEHFHIFWPHWCQVALSSICFLELMMAASSQETQEATSWFRDLHAVRKEMRLKSNMLPVLRLGLLRIDAVFWKGIDNVILLQPHVKDALQASLETSAS